MGSGLKILVVDDTRLIRALAERILVRAGHEVRLACDGSEAREQWRAWRPDVVLLDLVMPDESGWDVLGDMQPAAEDGPVVLIFSGDDDLHEDEACERGARGVIRKPFTADILLGRIRDATAPRV